MLTALYGCKLNLPGLEVVLALDGHFLEEVEVFAVHLVFDHRENY
jgi:hypothetical protein